MIRLTTEQVLAMHRMMLAETGGASGIREAGALDMALAGAFQTFDGKELYPSLEEKAARLAFSIVKNHPFVDGNKRTGLFVILVFLELNGMELTFTQQELVDLGLGLADGSLGVEAALQWVRDKARD